MTKFITLNQGTIVRADIIRFVYIEQYISPVSWAVKCSFDDRTDLVLGYFQEKKTALRVIDSLYNELESEI